MTKIIISQEGVNPINITLHEKSNEGGGLFERQPKPSIDISKLPKNKQDKANNIIAEEKKRIEKMISDVTDVIKKFIASNNLNIKLYYNKNTSIKNVKIVQGNFYQHYIQFEPINVTVSYGHSSKYFDDYDLKFNDLKKEINLKLHITSAFASCKHLTEGTSFDIGFKLESKPEIKL